jgi:hypothetical protein
VLPLGFNNDTGHAVFKNVSPGVIGYFVLLSAWVFNEELPSAVEISRTVMPLLPVLTSGVMAAFQRNSLPSLSIRVRCL